MYPQFFRQGDRLIRVGWSKSEKKEYEQRVPFATVRMLVASMTEKGANGRVFATEELLPIVNDGAEVPSYQLYAGIALLRKVGLIDQHGRRGYSILQPSEIRTSVEAVLRNLPEK